MVSLSWDLHPQPFIYGYIMNETMYDQLMDASPRWAQANVGNIPLVHTMFDVFGVLVTPPLKQHAATDMEYVTGCIRGFTIDYAIKKAYELPVEFVKAMKSIDPYSPLPSLAIDSHNTWSLYHPPNVVYIDATADHILRWRSPDPARTLNNYLQEHMNEIGFQWNDQS